MSGIFEGQWFGAIADLVYAEMTEVEAMTYYKNPVNGWVPYA